MAVRMNSETSPDNIVDEEGDCDMNYMEVPPLQDLAVMSVALRIWRLPDIRYWIHRHAKREGSGFCRFEQLHKRVLHKLSLLPSPPSLRVRIGTTLIHFGRDILMLITSENSSSLHKFLKKHFTLEERVEIFAGSPPFDARGSIINSNTFKLVMLCEQADHTKWFLEDAYELACTYCQEKLVALFWEKLGSQWTRRYINKPNSNCFVLYWTCFLLNDWQHYHERFPSSRKTLPENMLELSIENGILQSVQYFWSKLDDEQRSRNLMGWIVMAKGCGKEYERRLLLAFLISRMNENQKMEFLISPDYSELRLVLLDVLVRFWRFHSFLLPTLRAIRGTMIDDEHCDFLLTLFNEANSNFCSRATVLNVLRLMRAVSNHPFVKEFVWLFEQSSSVEPLKYEYGKLTYDVE